MKLARSRVPSQPASKQQASLRALPVIFSLSSPWTTSVYGPTETTNGMQIYIIHALSKYTQEADYSKTIKAPVRLVCAYVWQSPKHMPRTTIGHSSTTIFVHLFPKLLIRGHDTTRASNATSIRVGT